MRTRDTIEKKKIPNKEVKVENIKLFLCEIIF